MSPTTRPRREDVAVLMQVSRVISGAIAHSLALAEERVTLPQLRVLVMIEERGPLSLSAVARGLGVDPSNASRTCERLVRSELVEREPDATDRRNVVLTLSAAGRRLVEEMMRERAGILSQVLSRMGAEDRRTLTQGLRQFMTAAAQLEEEGGVDPVDDGLTLRWLT